MPARTPSRPAAATYVALLRGINVGGKNRLPMAALVEALEAEGCRDVRTYLQSGNAVFRASARLAAGLADSLSARLSTVHGLGIPVVLRTAAELARATRRNPFLAHGADPAHLHVAFLAERPARAAVAALDPDRSPPDELAVVGREVYLRLPGGVARTRITNAWLDARLGTTSTVRNWRTVLELDALARGA